MKECVTHHHACDCREREFALIKEVAERVKLYRESRTANATLAIERWKNLCYALDAWTEVDNEEFRKDGE